MKTAALKTPDGRWIARRLLLARTFRERLLGLLQLESLAVDEALLLSPGASIHTFGMPYPIDAVFLNGQMKILRLATRIAPWRIRLAPARTKHVLELPAGRVRALGLQVNSYLCVEHGATPVQLERRTNPCRGAMRSRCSDANLRFSMRPPRDVSDGCDEGTRANTVSES
jgi:uncharacterized membrane protein (UPF0127 family)